MIKDNNKGFTIIEFIITIAIMLVITGGAVTIIGVMSTAEVSTAATELNDQIGNARTNTMSKKGTWSLVVENRDDTYYATVYRDLNEGEGPGKYDEVKLGSAKDITITANKMVSGTTSEIELGTGDSVEILFNSSSGACLKAGTDDYYITGFKVYNSKLSEEIVIAKSTGKHYIKD